MKSFKRINITALISFLLIIFTPACEKDTPEFPSEPEATEKHGSNSSTSDSRHNHLKGKKFINETFTDRYDLYIEFVDENYYKYYALNKRGSTNEKDTITNNGRNCSFLCEYKVSASELDVVFDGPKSKWISGAYHTPISAKLDSDQDNLKLSLYLEYHKRSPQTAEVLFIRS